MVLLPALVDYLRSRNTAQLHDQLELLLLVISGEQRLSRVELGQNAGEAPDVYLFAVWDAQDDLRGAVVARLDVRVDLLLSEAARAEVNHLDFFRILVNQQDVLRL